MDRRTQHEFEGELFKPNSSGQTPILVYEEQLVNYIQRVKGSKQKREQITWRQYDVVSLEKLVLSRSTTSLKGFLFAWKIRT